MVLVSVCMITFNHENYIREAIESILKQKANFEFELIISNDNSNDNSHNIIQDIISTNVNGDLINYTNHESNQGMMSNFIFSLQKCKGKYIALCEGDDYWTDPLKLQKQVDFLEANNDFNICFHRANTLQNGEFKLHDIPKPFDNEAFHYLELLRHYNFISTASVVFRKPDNFKLPDWFYSISFGDLGLYKLVSEEKKIKCLEDVMSVYRIHNEGIFSGLNPLKVQQNYLGFYKTIFSVLNNEEQEVGRLKIKQVLSKIANLKQPNSLLKQKLYFYMLRMRNRVYI